MLAVFSGGKLYIFRRFFFGPAGTDRRPVKVDSVKKIVRHLRHCERVQIAPGLRLNAVQPVQKLAVRIEQSLVAIWPVVSVFHGIIPWGFGPGSCWTRGPRLARQLTGASLRQAPGFPWHRLNFWPLPQGQGWLAPTRGTGLPPDAPGRLATARTGSAFACDPTLAGRVAGFGLRESR